MERLSDYQESEKLLNSQLMSSILGFKEDTANDLQFAGKPLDTFKTKIPKFDEIFKT